MRTLKKGIVIFLILIFILHGFAPICMATDDMDVDAAVEAAADAAGISTPELGSIQERITAAGQSTVDETLTWGAGILYYPIQLILGLVTEVLESIASAIANKPDVTPEDVLFNKVPLIDTNFFKINNSPYDFVNKVRDSVSGWYYAMRTIAIIASLCVLIYIAIRMAISTSAEQKGRFKEMLRDWLLSFVLIFVLHYMMMLVLYGNDALVNVFASIPNSNGTTQTDGLLNTYLKQIKENRYSLDTSVSITEKFGSNMICLLLAGITIAFLIMYIKRFIVIAFLMILAPLITITYAIDKVRRWKSSSPEYVV